MYVSLIFNIHTNTNCTSDLKNVMYSVLEEGYSGEDDVSTLVQSMSLSRKALLTCDSCKQFDIYQSVDDSPLLVF
jgi:hypothetical protein